MDKFDSEFCGLFFGEGCATIQKINKKGYKRPLYRPQFKMSMRADDRKLLEAIQSRYGGYLYDHQPHHNSKLGVEWSLTNRDDILNLCNILLDSELPAKKIQDIAILKEFVELRPRNSWHVSDEVRDRLEELFQKIRLVKQYDFNVPG